MLSQRPQTVAIAAAVSLALCVVLIVASRRGGSGSVSRDGNTLRFTCGGSAFVGSHFLKLGEETEISGRIVSLERKPFMKDCGMDYALLRYVTESTYHECLKNYLSIGQCERERKAAERTETLSGFANVVLILLPAEMNSKFWKAGFSEGGKISLQTAAVVAIDQSDLFSGGGGFTVSNDKHYWVESF